MFVVPIGVAVVLTLPLPPHARSAPVNAIMPNATSARLAFVPSEGSAFVVVRPSATSISASVRNTASRAGNRDALTGVSVTNRKIPFGPRAPGTEETAFGLLHG